MNPPHAPQFLNPAFGRLADALAHRKATSPPATVLVVDDEPLIREILSLGLLARGFIVKIAADGAQAVEACINTAIDAALVDEQMPGMKGQETIAAIRRATPWTRCCLMSGDIEQCRSQGSSVTTLIAKPFAIDEVARVLRRLVEEPLGCIG
jgi:CheY-like chemotaxis protein